MGLHAGTSRAIETGGPVGPQIYHDLRERIIRTEFCPGKRISEAEIAGVYSVSRQPVREAFIKLVEKGMLEVLPQRGTFVRKITPGAVMEARFVREAIEADIVRRVAAKHDVATVAELRAQIKRQSEVPNSRFSTFMDLDDLFHQTLAGAAEVPYAWRVIQGSKSHMDRVRHLSAIRLPIRNLVREHKAIVDAIADGSVRRAETAMRRHLRVIIKDLPKIAKAKPEFFDLAD